MKKYQLLVLVVFILFNLACSLGSLLNRDEPVKSQTFSDEAVEKAVKDYFRDEPNIRAEASLLLSQWGFKDINISTQEGIVSIDFEQFDDLLPEQMQYRYLVAFLTAERFYPFCETVQLTIRIGGEPIVRLISTCGSIHEWRHGELNLESWFNNMQKQVLWDLGETPAQTQVKPEPQITVDSFSWFLDHPELVREVFDDHGLILNDPNIFYFSRYETDDEHLCSTEMDGSIEYFYHEDSVAWEPGAYEMQAVLSSYENNPDYVLVSQAETTLNGLTVVMFEVDLLPAALKHEKFAYIELIPGSDEWYGFSISESCIEQFGSHLPDPLELVRSLYKRMETAGYPFP